MDELAPTAAAVTEDDWSTAAPGPGAPATWAAWRGCCGGPLVASDGVPYHAHRVGRRRATR